MKFITFPKSCVGCPHETPTGMCGKLFDLNKFLKSKGNPFKIAYKKRRKDCPEIAKEETK